jgi:hypothetical protein
MLEREFVVNADHQELEFYYDMNEECAHSICENDLEIPQDCIKRIECYDDAFKVYLKNTRKYYREDWYVNLQRLEFVS